MDSYIIMLFIGISSLILNLFYVSNILFPIPVNSELLFKELSVVVSTNNNVNEQS